MSTTVSLRYLEVQFPDPLFTDVFLVVALTLIHNPRSRAAQ